MRNHRDGNPSIHALAERLEYHEDSSNAEGAQRIGGEVLDRGDALLISSKPDLGPGLNFVSRIRTDDRRIQALVDDACAWFETRQISPHFRVNPLTRPAGLALLLRARGFTMTEQETQMVLAGRDREPAAAPDVTVTQIELKDVDWWAKIQHRAFGMGVPSETAINLARATFDFGGFRPYVARIEGTPVGAATLITWQGVCGIYGVATLPEARHRGVGTALVRRMIADARVRGDSPICLQAETGADTQRWYERLGFRVVYDRTGWTRNSHHE
ncbi:MAG: GNAT family N-acetyltransferase [Chloroflexi bacterium]|nr:GNAT family N-acetyltransferase [Chloroflexota bacterium]